MSDVRLEKQCLIDKRNLYDSYRHLTKHYKHNISFIYYNIDYRSKKECSEDKFRKEG